MCRLYQMNGNTMVFLARMHERYELAVRAKLVTYKPIILACKLQRRVRNDRFPWHFNMLKAISRTFVKKNNHKPFTNNKIK